MRTTLSGCGCRRAHRAVPRKQRCCHWRPRHALSRNHIKSTIKNFPVLVPILILLPSCNNSSSLFPVAIMCTLLHRISTAFEVWYLHTPSVTVDRRQLQTIQLYQRKWIQENHALKICSNFLYNKSPCSISTWFISIATFKRMKSPPWTWPTPPKKSAPRLVCRHLWRDGIESIASGFVACSNLCVEVSPSHQHVSVRLPDSARQHVRVRLPAPVGALLRSEVDLLHVSVSTSRVWKKKKRCLWSRSQTCPGLRTRRTKRLRSKISTDVDKASTF